MRHLTLQEVLTLQTEAIRRHGGIEGVRDLGLVDSAVAQPQMTFFGTDLYPSLAEKAAAIGFSLISNHGFLDGNKRVGLAALDTLLRLNGHKLSASVDDAEGIILQVATASISRETFTEWVVAHTVILGT